MIFFLQEGMRKLSDWLAHWSDKRGDMINPILIRNLRQSVRSKVFVSVFAIIMLLSTVVAFMGYWEQDPSRVYQRLGYRYFAIFYVLLNVATFLGIPIFLANALRQEKLLKLDEQLVITTMTPRQMARGNILSGMVMMSVVFSALSPFIMFTYLLRGIDQLTIGLALIITFFMGLALCCITLGLMGMAEGERNKLNMMGLVTATSIGAIWAVSFGIIQGGRELSSLAGTSEFWGVASFVITLNLGQLFLWYKLAIAGFVDSQANQVTGVRVAFLVNFLLIVAWVGAMGFSHLFFGGGASWIRNIGVESLIFISLGNWAFAAFLFATEEGELTRRQKRGFADISWWKKPLANLLMPGPARGVLFVFVGLVLTASFLMLDRGISARYTTRSALVGIGFILGYLCLPPQIFRVLLPGKYKVGLARAVLIWGNIIWAIFSAMMGAAFQHGNRENIFAVLNPIWAMANAHRWDSTLIVALLLGLLTVMAYATDVSRSISETRLLTDNNLDSKSDFSGPAVEAGGAGKED